MFIRHSAHLGLMREKGHERDEELAARAHTDRIGPARFQLVCAVLECLHKLEHSSSCSIGSKLVLIALQTSSPVEASMSSVRARIAATGVAI
jgi:hypothetical protein